MRRSENTRASHFGSDWLFFLTPIPRETPRQNGLIHLHEIFSFWGDTPNQKPPGYPFFRSLAVLD
jgi:hypothetical protein